MSMDVRKLNNLEPNKVAPETRVQRDPAGQIGPANKGPSFQEMLNTQLDPAAVKTTATAMPKSLEPLKFSNHAVERMVSRGIQFNQTDLQKLGEAVDRAAAKGSKDSLILMNDSALIVSVKNKTVVTVMDKAALKENVFTNIDCTIVM